MSALIVSLFIIAGVCTILQLYYAIAGLILLWKNPQSLISIGVVPGLVATVCLIIANVLVYSV